MGIYFMYDNHTFEKLSDDKEEAAKQALLLFDNDPYGSIGVKPPHGDGLKVIANGNKEQFKKNLDKWVAEPMDYYEERIFHGIVHWRTEPEGLWMEYTLQELSDKYAKSKGLK